MTTSPECKFPMPQPWLTKARQSLLTAENRLRDKLSLHTRLYRTIVCLPDCYVIHIVPFDSRSQIQDHPCPMWQKLMVYRTLFSDELRHRLSIVLVLDIQVHFHQYFVNYKEAVEVWSYGNRLIRTNSQAICMLPWKPMWVWLVITAYINHPNIKFYQSREWR